MNSRMVIERSIGRPLAGMLAGALVVIGATVGVPSGDALAQAYPSKPVKIIVPYPSGSSMDAFSRVMAQKLGEMWKTGVVVELVPGAGGVVGTQVIAKAAPDGYTLGWLGSPHAINAALYNNLPFDPIKDFKPVVSFASTSLAFMARPDFKANSIADLLAMAKASPGKLNYASNGNGSSSQLTAELLASMASVKFTHVPYKNTGQLITDLMGGQVDFAPLGISSVTSHIQGGRLKALAVTSTKRSGVLPDVPAVSETIPGYESKSWMGLFLPAGAPDAVAMKVEADVFSAMKDPGVLGAVKAQALDVELLNAGAFAKRVENDMRVWKKIVTEVGITIQ